MSINTLEVVYTYSIIQCTHEGCGVHFALADDFIAARRADRRTFWCPNGHTRWYPGKTEAQEQKARADRLQRQLEQRDEDIRFEQRRLDQERRAHAATKGKLTKTKNRTANGVCPCCNRHFVNLERHMSNQHPDYTETSK